MNIVAGEFMETLWFVNLHIIQRSSKKHALLLIAMHMMILPVFLRAQGLIISFPFARPGQ
jgi:hypothetical protein